MLNTRSRADLLAWLASPKPRREIAALALSPSGAVGRTIAAVRGRERGERSRDRGRGVIVALSRFAPGPHSSGRSPPCSSRACCSGALQVVAEADPAGQQRRRARRIAAPAGRGRARGARSDPARARSGSCSFPPSCWPAAWSASPSSRSCGSPARAGRRPRADRTAVLIQILLVGFLGFAGVAALVPGGLPTRAAGGAVSRQTRWPLIAQAVGDALIAFLLAYRAAALRTSNLRDVAWFGLTGAAVVAIAAVALRSIEIPRILGPALLVLVFFLWDAIHSGGPVRRRDPRRVWETALLAVLAIVVIGWSIGIRG